MTLWSDIEYRLLCRKAAQTERLLYNIAKKAKIDKDKNLRKLFKI